MASVNEAFDYLATNPDVDSQWKESDILDALNETLEIAYSEYSTLLYSDYPKDNIFSLIREKRKLINDLEDLMLEHRIKMARTSLKRKRT